jgi:hypothetical protein
MRQVRLDAGKWPRSGFKSGQVHIKVVLQTDMPAPALHTDHDLAVRQKYSQ